MSMVKAMGLIVTGVYVVVATMIGVHHVVSHWNRLPSQAAASPLAQPPWGELPAREPPCGPLSPGG